MLASVVTFGPPEAFSKNDSPALEVVDEVHLLLPRLGVGERGEADVVLA